VAGRFRPIEDYALIGDARSAALVSRDGSIDWLCWPRFDSAPIFGALLDAEAGGRCHVRPTGAFQSSRRYEERSNVLVTTFRSATGTARLTDCFFATTEALKRRRALPRAMLVRRIECLDGTIEIDVTVDPTTEFGSARPPLKRRGAGSWTFPLKEGLVHVACDKPLFAEQGHLGTRISLSGGESLTLVLALNSNEPAIFPPLHETPGLIEETNVYWKAWADRITYSGPHRDEVVRSALVLKLLTFAPSGAVIAAPTTSLPERIGAAYNWDYRFCWLRDASDTVDAFLGLSIEEEAMAFLQWLLHATHLTLPRLQIMYSILGKPGLAERQLPWLSGYENSQPVRIGNAAHTQLQLDVYGEVIRAAAIAYSRGSRLSRDEKSFLRGLARFVLANWQAPDSGIWETRGPPRQFVHSKVMCWVALDRISRLAEAGQIDLDYAPMQAAADEVKAIVQERGFNRALGTYTSTLDGDDLDAAVLTLPLVGFEDANSPAMASTIDTLTRKLTRDGLVLRHQNQETGGEGAFLLCSFWLVQCLALQGKLDEAGRLFHELCEKANDVGLYSEEIEPVSGRFLGNFPQAFTHIGLINAALALERAGHRDVRKAGIK
jgi:GH15 family glucan-1,4-alpha-glucosidase